MTTDTVPQTVLFPDLFCKPLVAKFNQDQASSDGGAVLLKGAERVYGLVQAFAQCLSGMRAPEKIRHTLADLVGQRVFGIACGHPDCNDAEHLADDPIHKLLLGRDPVGASHWLASQPTLSRFENTAGLGALYDMGCALAAPVVERHRRRLDGRVQLITIDVVRLAQGADACGGKGQTAAGPQPPPVERLGNLSIGLFGGEHADLFDKRGRSTTQVRRRERQWTLDLTRRAAVPADGDLDYVVAEQGDILDEQPQHPLAVAPACADHPRHAAGRRPARSPVPSSRE